MRRSRPVHALTLAVLLLAACSGNDAEDRAGAPPDVDGSGVPAGVDTTENPPLPPAAPSRPETRQDTIMLEGMPEPIALRLVETPPGFPLPFTTYIPEDILFEPRSVEDGDAVRFVTNFGGNRNEDAFMEVYVYADTTTQAGADAAARAIAGDQGLRIGDPDDPSFAWSLAEYSSLRRRPEGGFVFAMAALGRHAGRFFRVVLHYPAEYGDGFGPRIDRILREWRWEDTGEMLGGT